MFNFCMLPPGIAFYAGNFPSDASKYAFTVCVILGMVILFCIFARLLGVSKKDWVQFQKQVNKKALIKKMKTSMGMAPKEVHTYQALEKVCISALNFSPSGINLALKTIQINNMMDPVVLEELEGLARAKGVISEGPLGPKDFKGATLNMERVPKFIASLNKHEWMDLYDLFSMLRQLLRDNSEELARVTTGIPSDALEQARANLEADRLESTTTPQTLMQKISREPTTKIEGPEELTRWFKSLGIRKDHNIKALHGFCAGLGLATVEDLLVLTDEDMQTAELRALPPIVQRKFEEGVTKVRKEHYIRTQGDPARPEEKDVEAEGQETSVTTEQHV